MTEYLFPSLIDGLVDGGLAADVAPRDLRAAVDVLRAACKAGTTAELATMAEMVRQFSIEVNATAAPSVALVPAEAPVFASPALSVDLPRSTPMFSTRITRKAMTIFAITLLAAGTAAAAAGGAIPVFEDDSNETVVETTHDDETNLDENGTEQSDDDQSDDESDDSSDDESSTPGVLENRNGDVDHHGKCTAWTHGAAKSGPAFVELQVAADAAELTVDEYCATVLGTTDDDDDESDDDESDDTSDDTPGNSGNGNGNSGNGNSGNGNGNSGNGNGNSGNGNSGNGNGNSGNGNSGNGKGNSGD